MGPIKPLPGPVRLTSREGQVISEMREWSFSASAEWVVGFLLALTVVAMLFV